MLRIYKSISFFLIILVSFFSIKPKQELENSNNSVNEQKENINKDDKKERPEDIKKDPINYNKGFKPIENREVTYSNPLLASTRYHVGYEKRAHSNLYTYEPIMRKELPTMHIYTPDGSNEFATKKLTMDTKPLEPDHDCTVSVSNCESNYKFSQLKAVIKQRGNGSLRNCVKKQFKLKFEEKVNVLGINNGHKFKSYVLNGGGQELSNLRDRTGFYLGKQIFNHDNLYSSDMVPLELYINNEYWGYYYIQEKQQVNKHRVNIDDVEDRDPKGSYTGTDIGYYLEGFTHPELDSVDGDLGFYSDYNDMAPLKLPDGTAIDFPNNGTYYANGFEIKSTFYSEKQKEFIQNYMSKVYKILYESIYNKKYYEFDDEYKNLKYVTDTNSYETINKVININSFVDAYLLNEIRMDCDYAFRSTFLQVDMSRKGDKKLAFSSMWDHDGSFGGRKTNGVVDYENTDKLYVAGKAKYNSPWFILLINENWFIDLVKTKWAELIEQKVLYNSLHYIDEHKINYASNLRKDFDRWLEAKKVAHNHFISDGLKGAKTYVETSNHLFNWLARRYNFLNTIYGDGTKLFNYSENNIYG